MPSLADDYWLLTVLSIVSGTLFVAIEVTGLVLALRHWRTGGTSARLAAAGFGLSIIAMVVSFAGPLLWESLGSTFYTPYGGQDESTLLSILIFQSVSVLGSLIGTVLIVAALWTAWWRADRAP